MSFLSNTSNTPLIPKAQGKKETEKYRQPVKVPGFSFSTPIANRTATTTGAETPNKTTSGAEQSGGATEAGDAANGSGKILSFMPQAANNGLFSFSQPPEFNFSAKALENLAKDLGDALESGERSDMTIKCGSSEFKVHEFVLAIRSPEFNRLLSTDMLGQEKREMVVTDLDPDTFRTMLKYIYSSNVNAACMDHKKLAELAKAADKYRLHELKEICFTYLTKKLTLANIGHLALIAHRYSAPDPIKKKVFGFCTANFETLCKNMEFKEVLRECLDEFFILPAADLDLTRTTETEAN